MTDFKVKTQSFEGPIELLLDLIERKKLHISEVSLAQVADSYIEHVERLGHLPIAYTANFILVASTLLLIKSVALLPTLTLTEEEKSNIEDLEERLRLYADMKAKSEHIKELFGKNMIFEREPSKQQIVVFSPAKDLSFASIKESIERIIANLPKKEVIAQAVVKKIKSLEEVITDLSTRIQQNLSLSFNQFAGKGKAAKQELVISFLAMLELVKQGTIEAEQQGEFGDIRMESKSYGIPRYE